jgi:Protein of unknown function (DUF4089)
MVDMLAYVNTSAALLDLPLDPAQAQRVAQHLERTAALAQLLAQFPMLPEHELAEIYCPDRLVDQ